MLGAGGIYKLSELAIVTIVYIYTKGNQFKGLADLNITSATFALNVKLRSKFILNLTDQKFRNQTYFTSDWMFQVIGLSDMLYMPKYMQAKVGSEYGAHTSA